MEYHSAFHLLSDTINKTGVSCVLIGGFAVNYYKFSRQTADIDFLITEEDFNKIKTFLEDAGYTKEFQQKVFARLKSNKRYLMDVDFMFVDKDTLDKIMQDAQKISIGGHKFAVPSLMNLIALKLHSLKYNFSIRKGRDLPDIISLIKLNEVDIKRKEFHQLCLKYANEDIYRKILENL